MRWLFWSAGHPLYGDVGGGEISAHRTAEQIAMRHEVYFTFIKRPGKPFMETSYRQIPIRYVPPPLKGFFRRQGTCLRSIGIFFYSIYNTMSHFIPVPDFYIMVRFFFIMASVRPDIIYCSNSSRYIPSIIIISKIFGVKTMLRVVGGDVYWHQQLEGKGRRMQQRLINWFNFTKADRVICFTKTVVKDTVAQRGCTKTVIIPDGVDTSKFRPKKRRRKLILFVGRRQSVKMPWMVRDAFLMAFPDGYTLRFIHGGIHPDRMPDCYASAKVFMFASMSEGFPLVFAEAMAAGTPIVTNDFGTARDIIKDGYNGYVCGNTFRMACRLDSVLSSRKLWKSLSVNCQKESEKYDWSEIARQVEEMGYELAGKD